MLYHNLNLKSIINPIMEHWRAHCKSNKAESIWRPWDRFLPFHSTGNGNSVAKCGRKTWRRRSAKTPITPHAPPPIGLFTRGARQYPYKWPFPNIPPRRPILSLMNSMWQCNFEENPSFYVLSWRRLTRFVLGSPLTECFPPRAEERTHRPLCVWAGGEIHYIKHKRDPQHMGCRVWAHTPLKSSK